MEKPEVGVDHRDAVLIARSHDAGIVVGSRRRSHELDAGPVRSVYVVAEREEGV